VNQVNDSAPQFEAPAKTCAARIGTSPENNAADSSFNRGGPSCRVVLLGASNLTRGISTVVETSQNFRRQPLEILTAAGHGRSYGIETRVFGRTLPSILDCSLWEALARPATIPTVALITDIGNDVLYGVEVPQIVCWVECVIQRLEQVQAQICMTSLPPIDGASLSPARFYFFRTLFFPGCRLNWETALDRAQQLHARLHKLGTARKITLVEQRRHWYGWDPIHIHLRHRPHAWHNILSTWNDQDSPSAALARGSLRRWLYLQTRRPQQRTFWGLRQRCQQPAAKLADGTTISFY